LEVNEGLVLVVGPNGVGKTNLLEAVHVAGQGFSPRTRADAEIIRFGADAGRIALTGARGLAPVGVEVRLHRRQAKQARLNGAPLRTAEQLRSEVALLVFTPDRLVVVKGPPAARRAYFDRVLGRLAPARGLLPVEYASAVGQRNAALRRVAAGVSSQDALAPWTDRVADLGAQLVRARTRLVAELAEGFTRNAQALGLEDAAVRYEGDEPSREDLEGLLERDLERGTTGVGPHLHDFALSAGARDLRRFGSQGEQRLTVLALLLVEAELLGERRERPLLLLDDVLSELDRGRRGVLVERLRPLGQTIVTATAREALPADADQVIEVSPGEARAA
jgi:DNA replication and repair protein RecF